MLPEKWAIKRNKKNSKEVNKWFKEMSAIQYEHYEDYMHWPALDVKDGGSDRYIHRGHYLYAGYTEISFEEFKQYVLTEIETEIKTELYAIC